MSDGPGGVGDEIARLRDEDKKKDPKAVGNELAKGSAKGFTVSAGGGKSLGETARSNAGLGTGAILSSMITMMPALMAQSFEMGQKMKLLQEMKVADPVTGGGAAGGAGGSAGSSGQPQAKPKEAGADSPGGFLESLIGGDTNPFNELDRWLFGGGAAGNISGPAGARGGAGAPSLPAEDIITRVAKGLNLDLAAKDPGKFIGHIISSLAGLGG